MKLLNLHSITLALLLTTALGLAGCRDTHDRVLDNVEETFSTHLRVTVHVNADRGMTRAAGPVGGEDGDGREPGVNHENEVDNVTVLLYKDDAGINTAGDPTIQYAFYTRDLTRDDKDLGDGKTLISYTSEVLNYREPLAPGTYHVIVLANTGCRTDLEGRPLSEVRDMWVTRPYTLTYDAATGVPDIANADNFVMTSAKDARVDISGDGGADHVKHVSVSVERLAARIDFSPGPLNTDTGAVPEKGKAVWVKDEEVSIDGIEEAQTLTGYQYVVVNASTKEATNDRFILTSVTPFNCLNSGTYSIKRVRNTLASGAAELEYLGQEKTDADGNGVNYVVDPWTDLKLTNEDADGLIYRNHLRNSSELLPETDRWTVKEPGEEGWFTPDGAGMKYHILDYTQENTMPPGHGKEHYATGLLLSGYYGHWNKGRNTITYTPQNYHYYIRHADPNGSSNEGLPMKYGVVRNNIYRIHVSSVNSLGQIQIVVSEWNRIDVPEIQI
ncbi:MAG: fimbria major subunit [Bacteroidaceae bacterium]|nr:fimbria major subunit [Bacteroidaceae bacterium]